MILRDYREQREKNFKRKRRNREMAGSFLKSASRQVVDVRGFLRAAAGGNSLKYSAEKGASHRIFITYKTVNKVDETGVETQQKELKAISGAVHEWTADGKFHSTICLKGVMRQDDDGNIINDGSCPFCDRVADGWNIRNYRKALEEETCKLTGEERKKHFESADKNFRNDRKAKEAKETLYMLIAKFRLNADGTPVIGSDNLPEYDLKVMKTSPNGIEPFEKQCKNTGMEMFGAEFIIEYPAVDDVRLLAGQRTVSPVFPNMKFTSQYPELENKINEDVAKFDWEGIEKSFPEWNGMTSVAAKKVTDELFEQWDKYQAELQVNPSAKYLEYASDLKTANPSLDAATPVVPQIGNPVVPNVPVMPTVNAGAPVAPTVPVTPVAPTVPVTPVEPAPAASASDVNTVFTAGAAQPIQL